MIKMQIHLKSYQYQFLQKAFEVFQQKLSTTYDQIHVHMQKTYQRKYTVLRGPHVHKKSREQFNLTEYHLIFSIKSSCPKYLIAILKTVSFYGVQVKITIESSSYLLFV